MAEIRVIPQLREKLALLKRYGYVAGLGDAAARVGVRQGTLEGWADSGSDGKTPGLVSKSALPKLVALFETAIRRHHPDANIEVVAGKAADLEPLLRPLPASSFATLIEREALTGRGQLFVPTKRSARSLAKRKRIDHPMPDGTVAKGDEFRIAFRSIHAAGHVLALQNGNRDWGFVDIHLDNTSGEIWLGGTDEDGLPAFVVEEDWIGPNRFVVFQTPTRVPQNIAVAIQAAVRPSPELLEDLAVFYLRQSTDSRALYLFNLMVGI